MSRPVRESRDQKLPGARRPCRQLDRFLDAVGACQRPSPGQVVERVGDEVIVLGLLGSGDGLLPERGDGRS